MKNTDTIDKRTIPLIRRLVKNYLSAHWGMLSLALCFMIIAASMTAAFAAIIEPVIDDIDLVLVMSVNPGFGGQSFIQSQLRKVAQLRKMIDLSGRDIILEIDGGVNKDTAPAAISAGVTAIVAGSAVFKGGASEYAQNIRMLRPSVDA